MLPFKLDYVIYISYIRTNTEKFKSTIQRLVHEEKNKKQGEYMQTHANLSMEKRCKHPADAIIEA